MANERQPNDADYTLAEKIKLHVNTLNALAAEAADRNLSVSYRTMRLMKMGVTAYTEHLEVTISKELLP